MAIIKIKSSKQEQNATDTVATTMPEQAQALSAAEISLEAEIRKQDPAILSEEKERRTVNSKVYRRNNGTAKAIYMQYPLHYEKNGELEEIDSTLTDTGAVYAAQQGEYKIEVAKTYAQNGTVRLSDSDISIEWNYLPSAEEENATVTLEQAVPETTAAQRANAAFSYGTDNNDTELKYSLFGGNVKENIVIHEKKEQYRFEFELKTNGVTMQLSEDSTGIIFYKAGSNTKIAEIPSPFMYDATGLKSYEVYYELGEESAGMYRFAVVASEDWINDETRVFPVTVDPQIITHDSSYITKQVQYRLCSCGSGGSTSGWNVTDNAYIKVSKDDSMEYRTMLTIKKDNIELADYPISSVRLILKPYSVKTAGYLRINGRLEYAEDALPISVAITNTFKNSSGNFELYVEPFGNYLVDAQFYASGTFAPLIEVEYLTGEKTRPVKQRFALAGSFNGEYNVATGDFSAQFTDVPSSDSVLGVGISHVYKKSAQNLNIGKNFRLNLNETLVKNSDVALDADYVYTDANGDVHGFKDTYYYISDEGQKVSITDKSLIEVDPGGLITYTEGNKTYEVKKEQRTTSGLNASTLIEGFKGVEFVEQRQDEIKQLEEQVFNYENNLKQYVKVNKQEKTIDYSARCSNLSNEWYKQFTDNLSYRVLILPENTGEQYISLLEQRGFLKASSSRDIFMSENEVYTEEMDGFSNIVYNSKSNINNQEISLQSSLHELNKTLYKYVAGELYNSDDSLDKSVANTILIAIRYNQIVRDSDYDNFQEDKLYKEFLASTSKDVENTKMTGAAIRAMFRQRNALILQLSTLSASTNYQIDVIDRQIDIIESMRETYQEQFEIMYKEYINLKYQLAQLHRQTPVNYLTDGKIIKGFNETGNLVVVFDKYENMFTVEYDDSDKIVNVYDGEDKQIAFEYRPDGLLGCITDTRGRRTCYDYNNGYLTQITFADGKIVELDFDGDDLLFVKSSDYQKNVFSKSGNAVTITSKLGANKISTDEIDTIADENSWTEVGKIKLSHTSSLTTITDEVTDSKVYYKLDADGNVYEYYEEQGGKVIKAERFELNFYQSEKRYSANPGSLGIKPYSEFSVHDFVDGNSEETILDEFNNPATSTGRRKLNKAADGQIIEQIVETAYTYNDDHKCIKETAVVIIKEGTSVLKTYTQITAYNYNAAGNVVRKESYIVGEELTTGKSIEETEYDANGKAVRSFSYNSLDSSSKFYTESEVAENGQTLADYDETGENKTEYEYIPGTNVVREEKMPNGSKFAYGYDENDTVTSISQSTEEGEENSTHTRYTCGEVTELVSGNNVVRYTYDGKRRVTQVYLNDLEKAYLQNTYTEETENGETLEKCVSVNAKNESATSYTDKHGKLRRVILSGGQTVSYAYNGKGETTSVTDGVTGKTETNTYDTTYDRLTNYTRKAGETAEYTETYVYDKYGQVSSVAQSGAATRTYSYVYKRNAAHDLASIGMGTYKFLLQTDKLGRNAGREITESDVKLAAEYIYYRKVGDHATNMPSAVYFGKKSGDKFPIAESIKYKYDKMGNIVRIDENGAPVVWYKYDALNRLVREDNKEFRKTWLYSYDNKGNILCKRETAFTLKVNAEECEFESVQYEYDGDKLLSYGTEACEYDEIGNPKIYRGKSVSWSNGRQMVSYNGTAFTYDGLGRRLSKGNITYIYDSNGRVIKQSNGIEFLYDNSGVAGIVYNNATYVYRKDAQGNIVALIDSNGNVVVEYKYDAWGNHAVLYWNKVNDKEQYSDVDEAAFDENYAKNKTLAELNPFRYRGYYYDDETGLYYLKSRYYDPETGRFITIDDITYIDPEMINGLNLYAYCGNNSVMNVDPNGYYLESYSERIDLISFLLEFSIGGSLALIASAIKTGARPNNIGIGIFKKQQANYLAKLTKVSRVLGKVATGLAIASVAFSVIDGINVDINRGYSIDRIVSNAAVNTAIYGGLTFGIGALGAKAGALLGSIVPGVGNVIGAVVGFVVGIGIGILLEWQVNGKSIIDHIRDGVYNFWKWLFG